MNKDRNQNGTGRQVKTNPSLDGYFVAVKARFVDSKNEIEAQENVEDLLGLVNSKNII